MSEDAPLPATEEQAEAEPRRYVGNTVKVGDLGGLPLGVPLQLLDLKPYKTAYGNAPERKPSTLVVLEKVDPGHMGRNTKNLTYYEVLRGFKRNYSVLHDAHEVVVLTGRQGKEMVARWHKHREDNFVLMRQGTLVGSDPEVFVENKKGVIPAFEFLRSKASAQSVAGHASDRGQYYWDGFQAEFTTAPAGCLMGLADSTYQGLWSILDTARAYDKKARLSLKSVVALPQEVIDSAKEEHVAFGCAPSYNAYDLRPSKQLDGRSTPLRFAGGHIHLGVGKQSTEQAREIIKAMDAVLGVGCVSLFAAFDNPVRREFYGLPGEYRTPPHGLEYRTLSNAWLSHPVIYHMVFDVARRAKDLGQQGMRYLWKAEEKEVIDVILGCDVPRARAILKRNEAVWYKMMSAVGGYFEDAGRTAFRVWTEGMETAVKDPEDIADNWGLNAGFNGHLAKEYSHWSAAWGRITAGKLV